MKESRSVLIAFRVTIRERRALERRAKRERRNVSEMIRATLFPSETNTAERGTR